MSKIHIVVVDDHEIVRHGLRLSLELEADMEVVGEARTGTEAVKVALDRRPDVMLLDVRLEDVDGPEVCRRVHEVAPKIAILMLTNYMHDAMVLRSLVAGAKGYVIKDVELAELKKMIRAVHRGNAVLDPRIAPSVISSATNGGAAVPAACGAASMSLSDSDLVIVRHVAKGLTNREIAGLVHLSPHTIKDRLSRICDTLEVGSRTEIVAEALRRGLI
ncbi:MAG: DNA-binding response regulator [Candidatus Rokuibacteriota bacterium]|nr:MAG: DNA-binding response regulator [Candidatus Rokubacteria bacterium]